MKMTKRTVLITGGTSGIGLELAKQLIDLGNTVIVTGRDNDRLARTKQLLPAVHTLCADVGNAVAINSLYQSVASQFPNLDTLINNAGAMRNIKLLQNCALDDLTTEIATNLNGPIWMVQKFLPLLQRSHDPLILNVSSGLAFVPFPASPIYSATKAGLHAYTKCLRAQLSHTNVRVVELAPPGTETPLFRGEFSEEMKGEKGMNVSVLVRHAISGLEKGKLEIRPGVANVLKIASRLAPSFMFNQMTKLSKLSRETS